LQLVGYLNCHHLSDHWPAKFASMTYPPRKRSRWRSRSTMCVDGCGVRNRRAPRTQRPAVGLGADRPQRTSPKRTSPKTQCLGSAFHCRERRRNSLTSKGQLWKLNGETAVLESAWRAISRISDGISPAALLPPRAHPHAPEQPGKRPKKRACDRCTRKRKVQGQRLKELEECNCR
jgi:hypothetical protein